MTRRRLPPTCIPGMPSSQPEITWCCPRVRGKALRPDWREVSNRVPVDCSQPVYITLTLSPVLITAPQPAAMSPYCRPSGSLVATSTDSVKLSLPLCGVDLQLVEACVVACAQCAGS